MSTETTATETTEQTKLGAQTRSREAANYRKRLRETEADRDEKVATLIGERDKAIGRAEALETAEVERIVTDEGGLADGADLWRTGVALDDHPAARYVGAPPTPTALRRTAKEMPRLRGCNVNDDPSDSRESADDDPGMLMPELPAPRVAGTGWV